MENCSSSSLGRCLAAFGLSGTEYASAEELVNALNNQKGSTQQISIKDTIKKQTTETKLTALYSDWKKQNDSIEKDQESVVMEEELMMNFRRFGSYLFPSAYCQSPARFYPLN